MVSGGSWSFRVCGGLPRGVAVLGDRRPFRRNSAAWHTRAKGYSAQASNLTFVAVPKLKRNTSRRPPSAQTISHATHHNHLEFQSTLVQMRASTRYDHRDGLPQYIRKRLQQSREGDRTASLEYQMRKVAPDPEPGAQRLRLAGKRSVLMSH